MLLKSIKYSEFLGTNQEWVLENFQIEKKNLVVGKNASGKTRILNVIDFVARSLGGLQRPLSSCNFQCEFQHDNDSYTFKCEIENEDIIQEKLFINNKLFLDRGKGGVGEIFANEIDGGKMVRFQTPTTEFASVVRRDSIQHAFLEPLYTWASSLRYYRFGTSLGKDAFVIFVPQGHVTVDERDGNAVVALFRKAEKEFGKQFTDALIRDLAQLAYNIDQVGTMSPVSIRIPGAPGELIGLYVKEKDLPGITDQHSMSQGMFRVLSLLTHLNYFELKGSAACVLIDDIGEGLDFDRSCRLIELLRSKADRSNIQIILSTNDRFVMNHVPLEEWSLLQRKGNHVFVRNNSNSHEIFEEFKFTGLSNFSFLEMDIIGQTENEG
jgi:hypothetical protein